MKHQDPRALPQPRRLMIIITGVFPPPIAPAFAWEAHYAADEILEDYSCGYGDTPEDALRQLVKNNPRDPATDGESDAPAS